MLTVTDQTLRALTAALNNAATSVNRVMDTFERSKPRIKLGSAVILRNIEKVASAAGMKSLKFPGWMKEYY